MLAPLPPEYQTILTPEALAFLAHLARCHGSKVEDLLARRQTVQARFDAGAQPEFLPQTRHVREGDWQVCTAAVPAGSSAQSKCGCARACLHAGGQAAPGLAGQACGDHGACGPQDGHKRAQLWGLGVHG